MKYNPTVLRDVLHKLVDVRTYVVKLLVLCLGVVIAFANQFKE